MEHWYEQQKDTNEKTSRVSLKRLMTTGAAYVMTLSEFFSGVIEAALDIHCRAYDVEGKASPLDGAHG